MIALVTLLLYPLAIQYERGGWCKVLWPIYVITAILDVIANYTELALITYDWPRTGEVTFSMRIPRLLLTGGWRSWASYQCARYLNYFAPDHNHISQILSH